MTEILEHLQPIFRDVLDDQGLIISRESNARSVEGWDSLAHINLIASIEQELHIRFALGELQDLKNVGEMIDLIERKLRR
ncbi:MAG TPA: acyl carrier protein [Thermoanaerobaculia bacterium]|nr:acyl carrier protein [Thermoanaerobaculia bacterium]